MPEIDNNQTADQDVEKQPDAGEKQPDAEQDKTADDGNGEAGDENKDGGDPNDPEKGQKKDAKVPPKKADDDNDEPPVRNVKTPKDFIIGRQKDKIEKLRGGKNKGGDNDEEADEDDDKVAPEDETLIKKVVAPMLEPLVEQNLKAQDEKEIAEFVKANPEFAPYEAKARKWIAHPSRRHLPVETVFFEVAGKDLLKIGAERQKKADEKAKNTQTGGGSNRGGEGGKKKVADMTDEEFANEQERVRRGEQPQK